MKTYKFYLMAVLSVPLLVASVCILWLTSTSFRRGCSTIYTKYSHHSKKKMMALLVRSLVGEIGFLPHYLIAFAGAFGASIPSVDSSLNPSDPIMSGLVGMAIGAMLFILIPVLFPVPSTMIED